MAAEGSRGAGINGGITANETGPPGMAGLAGAPADPQRELQQIMDGAGSAGRAFEHQFKEFCDRPENRPLVERHHRMEYRKAQRAGRKMKVAQFQDKVLSADYDAQKNVAPFLENRVLKRVVHTFCNDPLNDFGKWARNPEVLRLLNSAKALMDSGKVTEDQMEYMLLQQLQDPANPHHAEFELKTRQKVRVPTEQLVSALNEHLEVRRKGNDLYQAKRFAEALQQYRRALSVVELVVGLSGEDQKEVDTNRIAVQLNIAAVHIARQDFGQAVEACNAALDLKPSNVKALLRRSKALLGRHEYGSALEDLERVKALEPWNAEAEAVEAQDRKSVV